jgi:hypothetical protein
VPCGVASSIGSQKADLLADPLGRVPSSCFLITCRVPLFQVRNIYIRIDNYLEAL